MVYGLVYLYRASDFFGVVERFQPECVLFTPYWCRVWTGGIGLEDPERSDLWKVVDCYEFAFMGAFGMGYKLLVVGQKRLSSQKDCDNKSLWSVAKVVRQHALKVWRNVLPSVSSRRVNGISKSLVIRPGFLCELKPVSSAFVELDPFLKDEIPECVPVVIRESR